MRTARGLFLPVILLLAAAAAQGQEHRFTLGEAIAYCLQNSTSIKSKALALAAARQDLAAARAAYYPSLSTDLSYTHLYPQPTVQLGPVTYYGAASDPVGLSASLGQAIYTFGKLKGGVKLAEEGVAQAALDLHEEMRKTVVLIKQAFYGYLLALEVRSINRQTLDRRQEALDVAKQRYAAALVSDYDVLRAESDLESFRATLISSENAVKVALLNVRNALGIQEEGFQFELVGEMEPLKVELDPEALFARALQRKYELASFRKSIEMVESQAALNRSLALPSLAGFVGYSLQSGFDAATGRNEYFDADAWTATWTAGLSFSVPVSALFPWSKESAAVRKSALQLRSLKLQYSSLEASVRIAVESGILKVGEQEAKIASGRMSLQLAQRLWQSADEQYRAGYISSIDLKDAELGLNAAQLALAQAVYGYNQNVLDLLNLVGMDGEESNNEEGR
jgi:outer membrane protein